jgi:ryanodine receptor 2
LPFPRPLLQLVDAMLVMGALEVNDIQQLLRLIDPTAFSMEIETHFDEGLLQMKLDEPVKLQMCLILQHLCDYQLQYRVEGMIAFSEDFVGRLQSVGELVIINIHQSNVFVVVASSRIKNVDTMFSKNRVYRRH